MIPRHRKYFQLKICMCFKVEGFERKPDAQLNPKKKIFEACAPDLKVNADKVATYKGVPWTVNGQKCHSTTLTDVQIK